MLSESKYGSPKKKISEKSISELIKHYPHLIKAYLSYFLSIAIKTNDINLLNYLFSIRSSDNTKTFDDCFLQCVQLNYGNMICIYLQNGQCVNSQNSLGETALHIATNNNDYKIVQILLSCGADKYIKNKKGLTSYDYALEQGNKRIIELLQPCKSYSLVLNESVNQLSNTTRKCYTSSEKNNLELEQVHLNKLLLENMQKSKMDLLISQRSNDYPPELILDNNNASMSKMTIEEEFPIEYMKTNINVVSNHRYYNENINKTNEEIIDINKYTGLHIDNYNFNNKEMNSARCNIETEPINQFDEKIKFQNQIQITDIYEQESNQNDIKNTINLDLESNILKSPFEIQVHKDQIQVSPYIITNQLFQVSTEKKTTSQTINSYERSGDVYLFLSEISLEEYSELLINNGFDDIKLIIDQTKKSIAMTDKNLYDAGIRMAGDRAKILIHLEEKAGLYDFDLNKENVYYKHNRLINSMYRSDRHIQKFFRILSTIKMEKYLNNFITSGYVTIDLILMQMLSRQPITESILENEIKIDKIGYRARLITKFKEEAQLFITKGRNKNILVDSQNNSSDFCNCVIY